MRRFKFKAAQRFRIVVGNLSFFTTDRQVLAGVGTSTLFNGAVRLTRDILMHDIAKAHNLNAHGCRRAIPCGLSHRVNGYDIQMDVV